MISKLFRQRTKPQQERQGGQDRLEADLLSGGHNCLQARLPQIFLPHQHIKPPPQSFLSTFLHLNAHLHISHRQTDSTQTIPFAKGHTSLYIRDQLGHRFPQKDHRPCTHHFLRKGRIFVRWVVLFLHTDLRRGTLLRFLLKRALSRDVQHVRFENDPNRGS